MRERGYRSAVAAPVVAGGRTWGLVLVASVGSLGHDAEHRLAGFAELVALALESAEARAELKASRVRILEAGVTERRRLERNLHDGAQQRLVALAVQLRVLEKRLGDPDAAIALLRGAAYELEQALAELRELARGLHPAVLADRGLAPALETLASRSPLPVSVDGVPEERLAEPLEAAVYFVVAESLTNAVKHAEASELRVRMRAGDRRAARGDLRRRPRRRRPEREQRHRAARAGGPRRGARRATRRRVSARRRHPRARRAPADVTDRAVPDTNRFVEPTPDFDALYTAHRDDVWRYLRRRSASEPEDLTTEVSLVAWRRRAELPAAPLPWLYGKGSFVVVIPHEDEQWVADDGSAIVRMVMREDEATFPTPEDKADYDAAGTARPPLDDSPHALAKITVAGLSAAEVLALPTDPAALRAKIDGGEVTLAAMVGQLLATPLTPPDVKVALFAVLKTLPGATLVPKVTDPQGRTGVGVELDTPAWKTLFLFDPETGALLGTRSIGHRAVPGRDIDDWSLVLESTRRDDAPTTAR